MEELKKFINYDYKSLNISKINYSDDGKEAIFKRHLSGDKTMDYFLKVTDQKTFENNEKESYKITFLIENVNNNDFLYLNAFIELVNGKFIKMYYDYKDDEYIITRIDNIYSSSERTEESNKKMKPIFKQIFDYMENYNKMKIQRLINPEKTEEVIRYIKEYI